MQKPSQSKEQSDFDRRVRELCLDESVERARVLSFLFAIVFSAYGLTSIDFIHRFDPSVTYFDNVWPRLLFNTLPQVLLGIYLRKSKSSARFKFLIWIAAFSACFHIAAWIYVWPIALRGSPEIFTYVHAANTYIFAFVYAVVAPPRSMIVPFTAILGIIFVVPLAIVAYLSHDSVIFSLVINDTIFTIVSGIFLSRMIDSLRSRVAKLEIERADQASKFLGPVVSKAIFENQSQHLDSVRCKGFLISIDIRDSTEFQKKNRDQWLSFRKAYFDLITGVVAKHGGYIQKTVGDCHVINFGVMDYSPDLSDIPGLEAELDRAEERRMQHASDSAFACLDDVFGGFNHVVRQHYPEGGPCLGAGMDKGMVERGVQGNGALMELDVNGDPVNCSNRLQEYTKQIRSRFLPGSSLLVISPFASDYLSDYNEFIRINTSDSPVRNYSGQIKWVLVKEYACTAMAKHRAA